MPGTPVATAAAVVPPETALQHIESILGLLGNILVALLPIAAAVTAPFVKNTKAEGVVTTELPIAEGAASVLTQL
jgi:hypothetical protein